MAGPLRVLVPVFAAVSGLVFYGGLAMAIRRHYRMAALLRPVQASPSLVASFAGACRTKISARSPSCRHSFATCREVSGVDPMAGLKARLEPPWGDAARPRQVEWPIAVRAGR